MPVSAGPPLWTAPTVKSAVSAWSKSIGEGRARTDEEKAEPEHEARRPEEQLHDEGNRARRGKNGVLALVRLRQARHEDETHPDAPVDLKAQALDSRRSPREDHGEHDVGDRTTTTTITPKMVATMFIVPPRHLRIGT